MVFAISRLVRIKSWIGRCLRYNYGENELSYDLGKEGKLKNGAIVVRLKKVKIALFK